MGAGAEHISWLRQHVRLELERFGVRTDSRVLCAVSGGVDSIVLLDVLVALSSETGFWLGVLHADHGLRGEQSRQDAEFVRSIVRAYGLPFAEEALPVAEYARAHRCGLEMAARQLRYDFFARHARQMAATHLALAHTADDVAETLLLNLLRGAGIDGLSAMPPSRQLTPECLLIRPLLAVRKAQLIAYAQARGLSWREDPSNRDRRFLRNRIRWELLPLLETITPAAVRKLCQTATLLAQARQGIAQLLEPLLQQAALAEPGFYFSEEQLGRLPEFLRLQLYRLALQRLGQTYSPGQAHLRRLLELERSPTGTLLPLGKTLYAVREHAGISLLQKLPPLGQCLITGCGTYRLDGWELEIAEVPAEEVRFTPDPTVEYVDAERFPARVLWRAVRAGDRFHPLGMPAPMKLGDFLTAQRIPHHRRRSLSVLAEGSRVLWLCGVRLSAEVCVRRETQRFLRLQLRKVSPDTCSDAPGTD